MLPEAAQIQRMAHGSPVPPGFRILEMLEQAGCLPAPGLEAGRVGQRPAAEPVQRLVEQAEVDPEEVLGSPGVPGFGIACVRHGAIHHAALGFGPAREEAHKAAGLVLQEPSGGIAEKFVAALAKQAVSAALQAGADGAAAMPCGEGPEPAALHGNQFGLPGQGLAEGIPAGRAVDVLDGGGRGRLPVEPDGTEGRGDL